MVTHTRVATLRDRIASCSNIFTKSCAAARAVNNSLFHILTGSDGFVSRAQTQSLAHTVTSFRTSCISLIEDARSPSAAGGASNPSWRKNSSRLDNASPEVSLRGGEVVKPCRRSSETLSAFDPKRPPKRATSRCTRTCSPRAAAPPTRSVFASTPATPPRGAAPTAPRAPRAARTPRLTTRRRRRRRRPDRDGADPATSLRDRAPPVRGVRRRHAVRVPRVRDQRERARRGRGVDAGADFERARPQRVAHGEELAAAREEDGGAAVGADVRLERVQHRGRIRVVHREHLRADRARRGHERRGVHRERVERRRRRSRGSGRVRVRVRVRGGGDAGVDRARRRRQRRRGKPSRGHAPEELVLHEPREDLHGRPPRDGRRDRGVLLHGSCPRRDGRRADAHDGLERLGGDAEPGDLRVEPRLARFLRRGRKRLRPRRGRGAASPGRRSPWRRGS
eukprot:31041-Pelagococcus_subviridis.AAC.1